MTGVADYLVICYKAIWINEFTVSVVSLNPYSLGSIIARHESHHLWEADVCGCLQSDNTFVILSGLGTNILSLNQKDISRKIEKDDGKNKVYILHSLLNCEYLK